MLVEEMIWRVDLRSEFVLMEKGHISVCAQLFVRGFAAKPWCESWTEAVAVQRLGQVLEIPGGLGGFGVRKRK